MLKRRKTEETENHERWLVSYADFITLMFAFFTVMYATAQRNPNKEKEFENSVKKYFYAIAQSLWGTAMLENAQVGNSPAVAPTDIPLKSSYATAEAAEALWQRLKNIDETGKLNQAIDKVYHDVYGVRIRLLASALFSSGSSRLNEANLDILHSIGEVLKNMEGKIIVEGHTDDIPIRSAKYPSNWELSSERASKIVRFFSEFHEINPKKMVVVAYADSKPAYPNDSAKNRAKNRRIEILITHHLY